MKASKVLVILYGVFILVLLGFLTLSCIGAAELIKEMK